MKKIAEVACYVAYEPPVPEGMTHARDYQMESNRPVAGQRNEQAKGKNINATETGVTFRQPL